MIKMTDVFLIILFIMFSMFFLGNIIPMLISYPDTTVVALGMIAATAFVICLYSMICRFIDKVFYGKIPEEENNTDNKTSN
jgi:hypothetical protein